MADTQTTDTSSPHQPESAVDLSGASLGDFELIRLLGVGGMGQVYLARQRSLKRQVAIKILNVELAANETALRRFQAEAEAVANITHAHIVQVYAIGEDRGRHYMALEYVDGRNLRDYLEKKGIPDLPLALEVMRQSAAALERASELGFVHRDIKPENILLSKKGEVKVADFGLSRYFASDAPLNLTQTGMSMGTPLYMSPEQVRGQPTDPRSDIYSLGVTCYHMLAGEPPFRGNAAFDIAIQHVQTEPRPLAAIRPDLPAGLCAIVQRMMAKRPEDRYQSARELLNDLARFKDGAGLASGTVQIAVGQSSMVAPTLANGGRISATEPTGTGIWRYLVLAGLALSAAAGGAALHYIQTPSPRPTIHPDEALTDIDPAPATLRAKELRNNLKMPLQFQAAMNDVLELAEIYFAERKTDEALKLFEPDQLKKLDAFRAFAAPTVRDRDQFLILCGLGKAIALAYQDKANESNAEFQRIVKNYEPLKKGEGVPPPKAKLLPRGQIEVFLSQPDAAGANWRRAIGEALDRNAKNLDGKVPDELKRLLMLPPKRPSPRGPGAAS